MIKFVLYEAKDSYESLEKKLLKKAQTINAHSRRSPGLTMNSNVASQNTHDMDKLIYRMQELEPKNAAWKRFCAKAKWHPSSTGIDFYA
jgi:hypothetical protein